MKRLYAFILIILISNHAYGSKNTILKAGGDFSLELPPGWSQISREELDSRQKYIFDVSGQKVKYDYGYKLESAWPEYPYIFVSIKRIGKISENQISGNATFLSSFNKSFKDTTKNYELDTNGILSGIKTGVPVYDDKNKILWSVGSAKVDDYGMVNTLGAMLLTEYGAIVFAGNIAGKDYEEHSEVVKNIIYSVIIDPKHKYK